MEFFFLNRRFTFIFIGLILLSIYPYLNALIFSFDDYFLFYFKTSENRLVENAITQGRWFGTSLVNCIGLFSGNSGFSAILLSFFLLVVQWLGVALIISKQFELDMKKWQVPFILSFAFIHVFCSEILTFKVGVVNEGLSFVYLTSIGGWYLLKGINRQFILGVILIILSLATYQVFINIIIVLTLTGFAYNFIKDIDSEKKIDLNYFLKNEYCVKFFGIIVAALFYLIINKTILSIIDLNVSGRSEFITFDELWQRLRVIADIFGNILLKDNYFLIPFATKIVLIISFLMAVLAILLKLWLAKSRKFYFKVISSLFVLIILTAALFSSASASLFLKEIWLVPRMFTGFGFFVMMHFIFIIQFISIKWMNYFVNGLLCVLTFSFISLNHNIANEQAYLNLLDRNKAIRIVNDLERIENYKSKKIYINQRLDCFNNDANIKNKLGDINLSAFCTSWSKYELLQYVSGETFKRTTATENYFIDSLYKITPDSLKPRWPARDGIRVVNDIIEVYP